ncbi:MAG: methyltransferase domain-containing protein [bacterium]|nr:methyltransferase domain-containing protein [bacterium]
MHVSASVAVKTAQGDIGSLGRHAPEGHFKNETGETGVEFYDTRSAERVLELGRQRMRGLYAWQRAVQAWSLIKDIDFRGKTVLEVGPGAGDWTVEFLRAGARVVIVDISPAILEAVQMRAAGLGFDAGRVHTVQGDFATVHLPEGACHVLFAKDVIEHIRDESAMWQSIARVVRPSGHVVLATQNNHSLNFAIEGLRRRVLQGRGEWCGWDPTHLRFYNAPRLSINLKDHGFTEIIFSGAYYFPYRLRGFRRFAALARQPDVQAVGMRRFLRLTRTHFNTMHQVFAIFELTGLNAAWPFTRLGWSIAVRARRR